MTVKTCGNSACRQTKPLTEFSKNRSTKDGYAGYCKTCMLKAHHKWETKYPGRFNRSSWNCWLKRNYQIDADQYDQLASIQGNVCAICGRSESKKKLAVDHCHSTQKIRGLLCSNCNNGLGRFKDDPEILNRAIAYLKGDK